MRYAAIALNCSVRDLEKENEETIEAAAISYIAEKEAEVARMEIARAKHKNK